MAKHKFVTRSGRVIERDDNFHETLAPSAPVYREVERNEVELVRPMSAMQMLVNWVAGVLNTLLAIRFVFSLVNVNQQSGITGFIYSATNWMTTPFANLFNTQPNISTGYIDLPAVAAIVAISLVAWAITSLMRVGRAAV